MTEKKILETIGWIGGVLLIVAYALNSNNFLATRSINYQGMNLIGSCLIAFYTFRKKAYPNVALNVIWAIIAFIAIISIISCTSIKII